MAVEAYDFTVPQILPRPKMNDEWRVVNFRHCGPPLFTGVPPCGQVPLG